VQSLGLDMGTLIIFTMKFEIVNDFDGSSIAVVEFEAESSFDEDSLEI